MEKSFGRLGGSAVLTVRVRCLSYDQLQVLRSTDSYSERIVPYAFAAIPSIQAFQPYDVSLHMRLPISDSNISLGNFMATVTLMTPSNQTLAAASRPVGLYSFVPVSVLNCYRLLYFHRNHHGCLVRPALLTSI